MLAFWSQLSSVRKVTDVKQTYVRQQQQHKVLWPAAGFLFKALRSTAEALELM